MLREMIHRAQTRFKKRLTATVQRIAHWRRCTGLLPPDLREQPPRPGDDWNGSPCPKKLRQIDKFDEVRAMLQAAEDRKEALETYPLRPTWGVPATRDDESPGWHDVVRAYEEDR